MDDGYWLVDSKLISNKIYTVKYINRSKTITEDGQIKLENDIYYYRPDWVHINPKNIYSFTDMDIMIKSIYVLLLFYIIAIITLNL